MSGIGRRNALVLSTSDVGIIEFNHSLLNRDIFIII
jgi:hypothetical protein